MKYIGLDLGSRTLGVAISDETGFLARAYDTFRFKDDNYEAAINYTIDVCQKENVSVMSHDFIWWQMYKKKEKYNRFLEHFS